MTVLHFHSAPLALSPYSPLVYITGFISGLLPKNPGRRGEGYGAKDTEVQQAICIVSSTKNILKINISI